MNYPRSSVRLYPVINKKLDEIIEAREKEGDTNSKQSLVASLIMAAHKREVKK